MLMTELCQELKNWFEKDIKRGRFIVRDGELRIILSDGNEVGLGVYLQNNQYYRLVGSVFNDGVHQYTATPNETDTLINEDAFDGAVWLMAVPPAVIALANDIKKFNDTYGDTVNNPYSSESFGGYSYTKASGTNKNGGSSGATWQSVFKSRLNKWRKI